MNSHGKAPDRVSRVLTGIGAGDHTGILPETALGPLRPVLVMSAVLASGVAVAVGSVVIIVIGKIRRASVNTTPTER